MWEGRLPSLLLDSWIDLASDMRSRRSVARNCQRSSNRVLTSCCSRSRIPGMVEISRAPLSYEFVPNWQEPRLTPTIASSACLG